MRKKVISAVLAGVLVGVFIVSGVIAEFEKNKTQEVFQELPEEFSMDVTFKEIENSVLHYIAENKLDIKYGSAKYDELLNHFLYEDTDLPEVRDAYYGDYAAHYFKTKQEGALGELSGKSNEDAMNLTIRDVKAQNQEMLESFLNQ